MKIKHTIILAMLSCATLPSFAQKMHLTEAILELRQKDYDGAKEAIDKAYEKVKTGGNLTKAKDLSKFWFNRGRIYFELYKQTNAKKTNNGMDFLPSAKEAFENDINIVKSPNQAKSKVYLTNIRVFYANEAIKKHEAGEIKEALSLFDGSLAVASSIGMVDTSTYKNASIISIQAEETEAALPYLNRYLELKPQDETMHIERLRIHTKMGNNDAFLTDLEKAKEICGDCPNLILEEVNYYIEANEMDKLSTSLDAAIAKDPENATLYFMKGYAVSSFDKAAAIASYEQAIALDETYVDPYINLSNIYTEEANAIGDKINDLGLSKADRIKEDKLSAERNAIYEKTIPFMVKILELQPDNSPIYTGLRTIYYQLERVEEMKALKEKYGN
ncbi:MAG: hypothetical protein ACPGEC_01850 [Flavobacteriales bacterium]